MKKWIFIGLMGYWATFANATELENNLARAVVPPQTGTQGILAQASLCLRGRAFCKVLTWAQAADEHQKAIDLMKQRKNKIQAYQQALTPFEKALKPRTVPYSAAEEKKALEKLKGKKFIFIGETHFDGIRQGIIRALQTIRKQNQGKRILLATEMAVTYAPTDALPFQKAGTSNPQIRPQSDPLRPILDTARNLSMDLLALDDRWLERTYNNRGVLLYPIKLGNYLIEAEDNNSEVHQIANRRYGYDISAQPVLTIYALHDFFGSSWWGIQERNRQWTNYIKAVQNAYDVIVVYGGAGHFNTLENVSSVPQRLRLKNYAYVQFSKVPSATERAAMDQRLKNGGVTAGVSYETKSTVSYQKAPSVAALPANLKQQHAAAIARAEALEKQLGFYQDESIQMRIVLP